MPTIEEAKKTWCPMASSRILIIPATKDSASVAKVFAPDGELTLCCIANECAVWEWDVTAAELPPKGHCGLKRSGGE